MATEMRSTFHPTVTTLLRGIVCDAQELVRQQIVLFKQELRDDFRKTRDAAILMAAGFGALAIGCGFFMVMLPLLLNWLVPAIPLWGCFGIFSLAILLAGGVFMFVGIRRFQSVDPLHNQSVEALKENLRWTTPPK